MLNHQLRRLHPVVLIDRQPVGGADGDAGGCAAIELDGVDAKFAAAQAQLEVLFLEDALVLDDEFFLEQGCRETRAVGMEKYLALRLPLGSSVRPASEGEKLEKWT